MTYTVQATDLSSRMTSPFTTEASHEKVDSHAISVTSYLLVLLPRFLRRGGLRRTEELSATSYLDALRGLAALVVVTYHKFPYTNIWLFQLPFLRIVHRGKGMVDLFFVISGYVLSQRLLHLMRSQQKSKLLDSLASSVFRRYLRLYIPCALVTGLSMLLVSFGLIMPELRQASFPAQIWHCIRDFAQFCNPFAPALGWFDSNVITNHYDPALWTIPVEFRGSVIVYAFCIAACKLNTRHRMSMCGLLVFSCFGWQAFYAANFLSGVLLADISLSRYPERYISRGPLPFCSNGALAQESLRMRSVYTTLCVFSLFLLCQPNDMKYFGWPFLNSIAPHWGNYGDGHFWTTIASPLLILSLDSLPSLQTPLLWSFSQYIGDLSFGIYAMHILNIHLYWKPVFEPFVQQHFHDSLLAWLPFTLLHYALILCVADWFERMDRRVVKLGKMLQSRYFQDW